MRQPTQRSIGVITLVPALLSALLPISRAAPTSPVSSPYAISVQHLRDDSQTNIDGKCLTVVNGELQISSQIFSSAAAPQGLGTFALVPTGGGDATWSKMLQYTPSGAGTGTSLTVNTTSTSGVIALANASINDPSLAQTGFTSGANGSNGKFSVPMNRLYFNLNGALYPLMACPVSSPPSTPPAAPPALPVGAASGGGKATGAGISSRQAQQAAGRTTYQVLVNLQATSEDQTHGVPAGCVTFQPLLRALKGS